MVGLKVFGTWKLATEVVDKASMFISGWLNELEVKIPDT